MAFVLSNNSDTSLPFIQSTNGYNFFSDEKFVERLEFKEQSLIIIGDLINIELIVNNSGVHQILTSKVSVEVRSVSADINVIAVKSVKQVFKSKDAFDVIELTNDSLNLVAFD
jgi:hypothetical protein